MKPVCTTADYQLQKSCIPARKVSYTKKEGDEQYVIGLCAAKSCSYLDYFLNVFTIHLNFITACGMGYYFCTFSVAYCLISWTIFVSNTLGIDI